MKLAEAVAPLLGTTGVGGVCKQEGNVDKASGKDGFSTIDVLGVVDQYGKCSV